MDGGIDTVEEDGPIDRLRWLFMGRILERDGSESEVFTQGLRYVWHEMVWLGFELVMQVLKRESPVVIIAWIRSQLVQWEAYLNDCEVRLKREQEEEL
ncbi:MAG: hypothetical protein AABY75_05580 [Bacteroidota bacterium]